MTNVSWNFNNYVSSNVNPFGYFDAPNANGYDADYSNSNK